MGRWLPLATLVLVAGIVWLTCATVLALPQLEPDDFRYLSLVQDLKTGQGAGLPGAFVVENRWDHLWFVAHGGIVRFFRPTVVSSFYLDSVLYEHGPRGYLITTVLVHGACALLAAWIFLRLLGRTPAAVAASALFAAFACHAETIWYPSGRTDTIASLGFLAAFALHVRAQGGRERLRWWALPCFALALFTKELTIALPACLLAHDRWVSRRAPTILALVKRDLALYLSYAGITVVFLVIRQSILGSAAGSDLVWPYFVEPWSAEFPAHLARQIRSYAGNLFASEVTPPFADAEKLAPYLTLPGWILTFGVPLSVLVGLRREPRFWVLSLLALLTWLPTSFVYVSERYLYLPSFALAGVAGLALLKLWPHRIGRWIGILVLGFWAQDQARFLWFKNWQLSNFPREAYAIGLKLHELGPPPPPNSKLLFVNFPGDLLHAQFLEEQVRFYFQDPTLTVRVLSLMPERDQLPSAPEVKRLGTKSLRIWAPHNLMREPLFFRWIDFTTGQKVERPRLGFGVEVLEGTASSIRAFRVDLAQPIGSYSILRFVRGPRHPQEHRMTRGQIILQGQLQRIFP